MRLRGTVTYQGGRQEPFETGSAALAEWELFALRHGYPIGQAAPPMLSMLVVAWSVLAEDGEGFEVWRRRVADIDFETGVDEAVPPTLEGLSSA